MYHISNFGFLSQFISLKLYLDLIKQYKFLNDKEKK